MKVLLEKLLTQVNAKRLMDTTLELVSIPSPPGEESAIAEYYAGRFRELGFDTKIDREYPESPSVIAKYNNCSGPVLQLEGHMDTVSIKHDPPKIEKGRIYGRGAADMKSGLAAILEVCRIVKQNSLPCNLLITGHGQHEESVKNNDLHAPLLGLIKRRIIGDAVLVTEGPSDFVSIRSKGLSIFKFIISREGIATHELYSEGIPNPIDAAYLLMDYYQNKRQEWSRHVDPQLGSESFFLGSISSGDYYNTVPNKCILYGTRRNLPGRTFEEVKKELTQVAKMVEDKTGTKVNLILWKSGQPYEISPDELIVMSLREAYRDVVGKSLPLGAQKIVGNVCQFVNEGKVPTVWFGIENETAHADVEWVEIDKIVLTAKIFLATVFEFFRDCLGGENRDV